MLINWYRFSSPVSFYPLAGSLSYAAGVLAALLAGVGLVIALFVAPTDATQGDAYRIIYLHVPAAWMAMFIYLVMAGWSAFALGFNTRLSAMMAQALAPTGALMAALALWTGAFWGRPTWGTYWAWDARMTSTLILLFLYLGVIALRNAIEDPRRAVDGDDDGGRHPDHDRSGLVLHDRGIAVARAGDHRRARARRQLARILDCATGELMLTQRQLHRRHRGLHLRHRGTK